MNTFVRFFFEFISIFFDGIKTMLKGIVEGLKEVTNIKNYSEIINAYKEGFGGPEWLFAVLGLIILIIIFGLIFLIIFFFLKNKLRFGKKGLSQDDLLDEIANLNEEVLKLSKQNDELMKMKVSQLGLKPDEANVIIHLIDDAYSFNCVKKYIFSYNCILIF